MSDSVLPSHRVHWKLDLASGRRVVVLSFSVTPGLSDADAFPWQLYAGDQLFRQRVLRGR